MRSILYSALVSLSVSAVSAQSYAKLHAPKSLSSIISKSEPLSYSDVEQFISEVAGVRYIRNPQEIGVTKVDNLSHLLIVGNGMSSSFPDLESFDLASDDTEKNSLKAWKMLRGIDVSQSETPASVLEIFSQANPNSMHISMSGSQEMLEAISLHKQFMTNSNSASVLVQQKTLSSSAKNSQKVSSSLESLVTKEQAEKVNNEIFSGAFDLSLPSDRSFIGEYTAVQQLKNMIESDSSLSKLILDGTPDFYAIAFSSLWDLQRVYGVESEKYITAKKGTENIIQEVKKALETAYNGKVTFQAISFEGESFPIIQKRRIQKRDEYEITSPCYDSVETCNNSTDTCSGQGTCVFVKSKTVEGQPTLNCFKCKCATDYIGDKCEFEDKVALFHLIFWTSLVLIITLILICMTLAYIDPGTDTLLFRTGSQRPKNE